MITVKRLFGNAGERIAARYLKRHGYKIIERNYTVQKMGEIDIIAKDRDGTVVFVEVKRRKNDDFSVPSQNVDYNKRKRLTRTANHYIVANRLASPTRFDVIEVTGRKVNHMKGAFYAEK